MLLQTSKANSLPFFVCNISLISSGMKIYLTLIFLLVPITFAHAYSSYGNYELEALNDKLDYMNSCLRSSDTEWNWSRCECKEGYSEVYKNEENNSAPICWKWKYPILLLSINRDIGVALLYDKTAWIDYIWRIWTCSEKIKVTSRENNYLWYHLVTPINRSILYPDYTSYLTSFGLGNCKIMEMKGVEHGALNRTGLWIARRVRNDLILYFRKNKVTEREGKIQVIKSQIENVNSIQASEKDLNQIYLLEYFKAAYQTELGKLEKSK